MFYPTRKIVLKILDLLQEGIFTNKLPTPLNFVVLLRAWTPFSLFEGKSNTGYGKIKEDGGER